jgi:hypothetical protein
MFLSYFDFFYIPHNLTTGGERLYFLSEGRRAADFLSPLKINSFGRV